jgi:hypothetical protein
MSALRSSTYISELGIDLGTVKFNSFFENVLVGRQSNLPLLRARTE